MKERSYKLGIAETMCFVCKRHCLEKENKTDQEKNLCKNQYLIKDYHNEQHH